MSEMRKIVIVSTVGLIYDGITSVISSYLEAIDKTDLEIYVVSTIKAEPNIEEKIEKLGCKIVHLPSRKNNTIKYFISLQTFIHRNGIEVIHAHGNSATLAIEMLAGLLGGCKKRIAHSHNTKCEQVKADKLLRPLFDLLYTDALACGDAAGKWLFCKRPFTILKNGRDVNKYIFALENRNEIRSRYSLKDTVAIGHVGGFFEQKNHVFLIEVFREILNINSNAKLFLIGDGPSKSKIESSVKDIKEDVIFTGVVDNVNDYLQALDGMLLPSLFEGLPLVTIEWQINGLPSLLSDKITNECKLTETVKFESLAREPKVWAEEILNMIDSNNREKNSLDSIKVIKEKGFDIRDNAKILRDIYLS